jgi:thiaminase/transcriptional activator TenA
MKFSESLKSGAGEILKAQYDHPFVKGLGDGTLQLEKFRFYMIQDTLYIVEYARAMAWTAPLLPDVNDIIAMLEAARESFKIESMLKEQYFGPFGISIDDALKIPMAPTCKAYVDHLIRYTHGGTCAEALAAILPCGWVYVEIGAHFTEGRIIPDTHRYKSWLMTYAVPEFRNMVNWWFSLLDNVTTGMTPAQLEHIKDIFITSCRYEWMFWDMAWRGENWKP